MKKFVISLALTVIMMMSSVLYFSGCSDSEDPLKVTEDGSFNRTCTFEMDLEHNSEIANPLDENSEDPGVQFLVLISKLIYGDLFGMVNTATQPKQLFDMCDVYFMPDGSIYYHSVSSEPLREKSKANSALLYSDMTKEEADALIDAGEVKVAGYRIENTKQENIYTVHTSLQDLPELTYNGETGVLTCKGKFKEEIYNPIKTKPIPDATKKSFDYSSIPNVGEIEAKYLKNGSYEVESVKFKETDSSSTFYQHKVWYPKELENSDKKYPLVVMANGTGTLAYAYEYVFEHLASWGFIVIGNDENMSGFGNASEASLKLMLSLNGDSSSIFYNKVDTDNIGSAGHSQGGAGAVNAVLAQPNGNKYTAIYSASNTSLDDFWAYDPTRIKIPFFAVTAENDALATMEFLQNIYNKIDNDVTKVVARRLDSDHGKMLTYGDGYMTAWFLWHLKGDNEAKAAFTELASNPAWADVAKNF